MKKKTAKSSGNVFADLDFDPAEAAVLQMRSNLISDLRLYIEKQKLTRRKRPSDWASRNPTCPIS